VERDQHVAAQNFEDRNTEVNIMDLLERYLQAVGKYLPEETRNDTIAELRANLLERMDARAEELGRPLESGDVATILREHGKPEAVALRYLPQQSLIGPTIFPFYLFTLRKMLPLIVLAYAVAQAAALFLSGADGHLAGRIVVAVFKLVPVLLISAACVTLAFVLVEFALSRGQLQDTLTKWDPMELPAVKVETPGEKPKSAAKRVVDLCVHCLWMAYVLWVPWHPFWLMGPGVFVFDGMGVALAPVWHVFYVLLIVLLCVQLLMKLTALAAGGDRWTRPMKWVADLFGVVSLGIIACAKELLVPANANANLDTLATVNHAMSLGFRIALVFAVAGLVKEAWQLAKRKVPVTRLAL
jgi:hypothetical protein